MNESTAFDFSLKDIQSVAPLPSLSEVTDFGFTSCLDEIEPLKPFVLPIGCQSPNPSTVPQHHRFSEEEATKVLLDMLAISGSATKTLSPEILSSLQAKTSTLRGQMFVDWDDGRLIRDMTEAEKKVNVVEMFRNGAAARMLAARGFVHCESHLERLLRKAPKSLRGGKLVVNGIEWSPTHLLNALMSPSEDLKAKMKFTSRSKGPQPIRHFADVVFLRAVMSPFCKVYPEAVHLVPVATWKGIACVSFGELVEVHFQRRNNDSSRFIFKLYNALLLTDDNPELFCVIGLKWVSDAVLGLNKRIFAQLIGISPASIDGALLNAQGNFSTHGFVEITKLEHLEKLGVPSEEIAAQRNSNGDYRLLVHAHGIIKRSMPIDQLDNKGIRWQKEPVSFRDACKTFGLEP